jgi:rhodanese-related sulfurtransferase
VAGNILKGDMAPIHWREMGALDDSHVIIDLREAWELKSSGAIPGAVNIPLDELRERLPGLDRDKTHVLYCAVGMRGYLGQRILMQNGFRAKNLSGGYATWLYGREVK